MTQIPKSDRLKDLKIDKLRREYNASDKHAGNYEFIDWLIGYDSDVETAAGDYINFLMGVMGAVEDQFEDAVEGKIDKEEAFEKATQFIEKARQIKEALGTLQNICQKLNEDETFRYFANSEFIKETTPSEGINMTQAGLREEIVNYVRNLIETGEVYEEPELEEYIFYKPLLKDIFIVPETRSKKTHFDAHIRLNGDAKRKYKTMPEYKNVNNPTAQIIAPELINEFKIIDEPVKDQEIEKLVPVIARRLEETPKGEKLEDLIAISKKDARKKFIEYLKRNEVRKLIETYRKIK